MWNQIIIHENKIFEIKIMFGKHENMFEGLFVILCNSASNGTTKFGIHGGLSKDLNMNKWVQIK